MNHQENKLATIGKLSLVVLFWICLGVESYALFTNHFLLYGMARPLIVPLLFFRVFSESNKGQLGAIFFISFVISILADVLTLYGNSLSMGYVGLSMYSISYLALGCFILNKISTLDVRYIVLIMGGMLFFGVDILWIIIPKSRDTIFYLQLCLHVAVILFLLFSAIYLFIKKKEVTYPIIFLIAIFFVILANGLYAISLLKYHIHNPIVNMVVGLSHGLYIYFFANGAIKTINEANEFD